MLMKNQSRLTDFLAKIYQSIKILRNTPNKFSLIKKQWNAKKLFIAELSNEKLFQKHSSSEKTKSGQCFFVPELFQRSGLEKLFSIIREKQYRHIAVLGNHPWQKKLISALNKRFSQLMLKVFTDLETGIEPFNSQFYEVAILIARKENAISLLRKLLHTLRFSGDIIIGSKKQYFTMSTKEIESIKPLVVCAYPCAGTNRFIFSFEYLMKKLHWKIFPFSPFVRNTRYIHSLQKKTHFP